MAPQHADGQPAARIQGTPAARHHTYSFPRILLTALFLSLLLFSALVAPWPVRSPVFASALGNPNPPIKPPAWLKATKGKPKIPDLGQYVTHPKEPGAPGVHPWRVSMKPAQLNLTTTVQHFVSSDNHLLVDIPANSVDATQLAEAGGAISLYITEVLPSSGGLNSEHVFFGMYEFQFFDAHNKPLGTLLLHHPFTVRYHLSTDQQPLVLQGQQVYALWEAVQGSHTPPALDAQTEVTPRATSSKQTIGYTQVDRTGTIWSISSAFSAASLGKPSNAAAPAVQASGITFGTEAPQATWGKPADFQVGLSSGSLNYNYPLNIPAGPGGLQPSLSLNYSSASVSGNHNLQSTDPWVGQGWNLDLGSISWGQVNVTPNGSPTLENIWTINDSSGISGQLIPPELQDSTIPPYVPSSPTPSEVWHTAPESHAKVIELMVNGMPCWRMYLPNGIMEEFGCASGAEQGYVNSHGDVVTWRWDLDLMTDANGNQVQISYQRLHIGPGYVRDAVLADITYDDPTCHNTTTACSNWHPQVDIHFDAGQGVVHLHNSGCGNGSNGQYRCDAPQDLSHSGGLPVPEVLNSYVLNDLKVEVQGNVLREYIFTYDQGGPQTIQDPLSNEPESIAGYLNLVQIQELGTNGTSLNAPVITIQYSKETQHYSDLFYFAPSNDCSPTPWSPRSGNNCYLWSQSFWAYYLTSLNNGEGWQETVNWAEAHGNTHGVDGGAVNDALNCDSNSSPTDLCSEADDKNWSRMVVSSRTAVSNGVTSTWTYAHYYLQTGLGASFPGYWTGPCSPCSQSFDWGNQNDDDYADYYNGTFEGFVNVVVTQPDNSVQVHSFVATDGWGLYSGNIHCYLPPGTCVKAPFNGSSGPVLAGEETVEQDEDSGGNLQREVTWSYSLNCPPPGVPGDPDAQGGTIDPGPGYLFSELDHNNPTLVCDPRVTQKVIYSTDGINNISDSRVVHQTIAYSYDGNNCGSNYDYGNISQQDVTASDVGAEHDLTEIYTCPNDNLSSGLFLTDLPGKTFMQDQLGTQYGCHANFYGNNTGDMQPPIVPNLTRVEDHTAYNTGCAPITLATLHSYDASGNVMTTTDPDGHLGCTYNSSQYSACATYDPIYQTLLSTATNAQNRTTTWNYDLSSAGGFGQWLTSAIDLNGLTTSYQYDVLGRLTAVIRPGDSQSSPTVGYTYINTCTSSGTSACIELDKAVRYTIGGPTSTTKRFYDGWGHLIETQAPSPTSGQTIVTYLIYDSLGRQIVQSLPYAITTPTGYVTPDQGQARTITSYDSLGRSLGSVTYNNLNQIVESTTISYKVDVGVLTLKGENNTAYEQTSTLDSYNHQAISYTDGLGRTRYTQTFTGTSPNGSNPYSVVRTVGYSYDVVGNRLSTLTYDSTGTVQASYTATYDGLQRLTGYNDSDLGSCSNMPLPPGCQNSGDTAWHFSYDADGNLVSQTDPRNDSVYTGYDVLDRPLCSGNASNNVNPSCTSGAFAQYFYDSYDNTSNPGVSFPTGCTAPGNPYTSAPVGRTTAEAFSSGAGSGWRCYGYDARGEVDQSSLSVTADGTTSTNTMNMSYNDGGELTALVYPDQETLTSQYDTDGHLLSAYFGTSSSPDPVNFLVGQVSYTANGLLSGLAMGGSGSKGGPPPSNSVFSTGYGYDGIQRPQSSSVTVGSNTIWSQARTYDNVSNVLQLATTVPTLSGGSLTDNQSFCYDALDRLVWAGNTGSPSGGDHCGNAPSGSTTPTYQQPLSYDNMDRMTSGPAGTMTYDVTHVHAADTASNFPNQYASYDAMGNMTCRNVDTGSGHTCGSGQTGALMTYDNEGRLSTWTAPSGTTATDSFLYDNEGNRVLQRTNDSNGITDTITFDSYLEIVLHNGTTLTTKYYSVGGQRVAMRISGTALPLLYYLVNDMQGGTSLVLTSGGGVQAVQLYAPYGAVRYSQGTVPTTYNYTGQRLDSETGLLYYGFRYYDPLVGQFVRADSVETNAGGMDGYGYVGGNPETLNDPTGQYYVDFNGNRDNGNRGGSGNGGYSPPPVDDWWNDPWARTVAPAAPLPHLPAQPIGASGVPSPASTCNATGNQAFCMPFGVNYSLSLSIGGEIAIPGVFCIGGCARGGDLGGGYEGGSSGDISSASDSTSTEEALTGGGQTLYHYTSEEGFMGITESESINPSTNPRFAHYGSGQYLTDIPPEQVGAGEGQMSLRDLSLELYNSPRVQWKLAYYFEINVNGLEIREGRPHVFLVPGEVPLNLRGRIVRSGMTIP